jgi:hypothetical protein
MVVKERMMTMPHLCTHGKRCTLVVSVINTIMKNKPSWYRIWHTNRYAPALHWIFLFAFASLMGGTLVTSAEAAAGVLAIAG